MTSPRHPAALLAAVTIGLLIVLLMVVPTGGNFEVLRASDGSEVPRLYRFTIGGWLLSLLVGGWVKRWPASAAVGVPLALLVGWLIYLTGAWFSRRRH